MPANKLNDRAASTLFALALGSLFASGCSGDDEPCTHRVCDIREMSCIEFAAEVVACQRDGSTVVPEVRFSSLEDVLAEQETPTPEELEWSREYYAGEALVGLMPAGYDPANEAADSLDGVLAYYDSETKEIVVITKTDIGDRDKAYRVLVHELIHAQQDAEYDLEALWDAYGTTFSRGLGARAAIEGEATLFTLQADLELSGLSENQVDWQGYFNDFQNDRLLEALKSEVPSLDVRGLFPYAFGVEQVYRAWHDGGLDEVRKYVQHPPDSVRQVMAGYSHRPPEVFNFDTQLDPRAVPVLPGHTYLGGGAQDSWLLNAMLQRRAGIDLFWSDELQLIEADHLSVWSNDETKEHVAVWRLVGDTVGIEELLTRSQSSWVEAPESATTHHLRRVDDDWILVATETSSAPSVFDTITGWQSRDQTLGSAGLTLAPKVGRLLPPHRG